MMLMHKTFLFLGLLVAGANAAPTANTHHLEARQQPSTLWRADTRSPEEIKKARGFHTFNPTGLHEYGLFKHVKMQLNDGVESAYVSTTSSKPFVESWSKHTMQGEGGGFIYEIAPSGNFVDVTTIIGSYLKSTIWQNQYEFAAAGSIQFGQIKGWQKYTPDGHDDEGKPKGTFGTYEKNPAYESHNYPKNIAPIDYAIAGFPKGHSAWKTEPWKSVAPDCEGKSTIHKRETTTRRTSKKAASSGKKSPGQKAGSKGSVSGKTLASGKGKPAATTCKKPETAKQAYMKLLKGLPVKGSSNGALPKKTTASKNTTGPKKASTGTKSKTHPH
jgi:cholera enterotoxin subunit A